MASTLKYSTSLKNGQQDQITSKAGANAVITLYDGAQPASPDTAVTTQNALSVHDCSATLAPASAAGVLTASAIGDGTGTAAAGTGKTATWFRLATSAGVGVLDGSVGQTGQGTFDMAIDNPSIAQNQKVSISGFTDTNPN